MPGSPGPAIAAPGPAVVLFLLVFLCLPNMVQNCVSCLLLKKPRGPQ